MRTTGFIGEEARHSIFPSIVSHPNYFYNNATSVSNEAFVNALTDGRSVLLMPLNELITFLKNWHAIPIVF
jgi:hypothetical protein